MIWAIVLIAVFAAMTVMLIKHKKQDDENKFFLKAAVVLAIVFSIVILFLLIIHGSSPPASAKTTREYTEEVYVNGRLVSRSTKKGSSTSIGVLFVPPLAGGLAFLLAELCARFSLLDKRMKSIILMSTLISFVFLGVFLGFVFLKDHPPLPQIMFSVAGVSLVAFVVGGIIISKHEHK